MINLHERMLLDIQEPVDSWTDELADKQTDELKEGRFSGWGEGKELLGPNSSIQNNININ